MDASHVPITDTSGPPITDAKSTDPSPADIRPGESSASSAFAPLHRIEFLRAFYFVFDSSQWLNIFLAGTLCMLASQVIPFVPYIVFGGYMITVIEWQTKHDRGEFPPFVFDQFTEYLSRGVWPFLIALPFGAMYLVLYLISYFGGVFGLIALVSTRDDELVGLALSIGIPAMIVFWMVFVTVTGILSSAMMLRAGLSGTFREGIRIGWVWDFFRRTWVEQLVAFSFVMISTLVLSLIGMAALCVGYFVTISWAMIASCHLWGQLYRLYLTRGGEPIPARVKYVAPVPAPTSANPEAPVAIGDASASPARLTTIQEHDGAGSDVTEARLNGVDHAENDDRPSRSDDVDGRSD